MLIDGDNAQPSLIENVLGETAKYGILTTRRIYGDWTTSQMSGWKDSLHAHAIQPMQEFRYTVGKNATDSALIIDAMDLLHAGNVGGFDLTPKNSGTGNESPPSNGLSHVTQRNPLPDGERPPSNYIPSTNLNVKD